MKKKGGEEGAGETSRDRLMLCFGGWVAAVFSCRNLPGSSDSPTGSECTLTSQGRHWIIWNQI